MMGRASIAVSLSSLTDRLYDGERAAETWAPCKTCSAQERCEVFRAARIFGPGGLADEDVRARARQRLFDALQAVHLRGETQVTVRELRAALVYILFGVHYCSDYHAIGDISANGDIPGAPPPAAVLGARLFARVGRAAGGSARGAGAP